MKNDLLKMADLTKEDIIDILNLASQLKYERKNGIEHKLLAGKTARYDFQKASTRNTRPRLKPECTSSAVRLCFCRAAIYRSDAASRLRTPRAYSHAISTEL